MTRAQPGGADAAGSDRVHGTAGAALPRPVVSSPLHALLSGLLGCVALIDASGRYLFVNRDFLAFAGRAEADVVGRTMSEVFGPNALEEFLRTIADLAPLHSMRSEGWSDLGPLGRRYVERTVTAHVESHGEAGGEAGGEECRFVVASRDLTELVLQRQELADRIEAHAAADAYHSVIVDHALDAIVVIDDTGSVVDFNPAAVSIFGYSREEAMRCQIADLIIPAHLRSAHDRGMKSYLQSGVSRVLDQRLELEARRANGEHLPVELTITEVRLGARRLFAAHLRDLTAAHRAQAEIERQREALHQKDKLAAMGSLLAGVAHELNNPLLIVLGQAMVLHEKLVAASQASGTADDLAKRSASIETAAHRCAKIVRSFLDMARQRKHEPQAVHLPQLVAGAVDLLAYTLQSSGVVVETDMPESLPTIWIDPDQLHQVVVNLVVNACQALDRNGMGQRRIAITASHAVEARTVVLRICDNGPGIAADIRSRIFDPFFTTKPQGSGTGIGLAVSRGLVESHGGSLDVEDTDAGSGACFLICLPIGRLPIGSGRTTQDDAPLPAARPAPARRKRQVLVIDDEAEIADLLCDIVEGLGFIAVVAESGEAAQRRLDRGDLSVDAILCDIRMPDGDGPSFFDWLARRHPHLSSRIGFVTGDTLGPSAGRFLARTGCPVVEKPFTPQDIGRILESLTAGAAAE